MMITHPLLLLLSFSFVFVFCETKNVERQCGEPRYFLFFFISAMMFFTYIHVIEQRASLEEKGLSIVDTLFSLFMLVL